MQGKDADIHKHIPKVVNECIKRLRQLLRIPKEENDNHKANFSDQQTQFEVIEDSIL